MNRSPNASPAGGLQILSYLDRKTWVYWQTTPHLVAADYLCLPFEDGVGVRFVESSDPEFHRLLSVVSVGTK